MTSTEILVFLKVLSNILIRKFESGPRPSSGAKSESGVYCTWNKNLPIHDFARKILIIWIEKEQKCALILFEPKFSKRSQRFKNFTSLFETWVAGHFLGSSKSWIDNILPGEELLRNKTTVDAACIRIFTETYSKLTVAKLPDP